MSEKVVELQVKTSLPIAPDKILSAAMGRGMIETVVIGFEPDFKIYFASSTSRLGDVLLLLELARDEVRRMAQSDNPYG